MLNRLIRRVAPERGQSLILLVLGMTVMFVVGAIVVDVGLWLSERRGSQTDADFAATAGAFELLDPGASAADAVNAATNNLGANDEQGNATFAQPVVVDDSCFDRDVNDAVTVDVDHNSRGLFFDIFGIADPDIGAHAKACVGAAQAPGNIVPFQISDNPGPCFDSSEEPIFTVFCPIELGSQSNPRGLLDLQADDDYCSEASGAGDIEDMIEFGAPGMCLINTAGSCDPGTGGPWYDCVAQQPGNPKKVLDGVNARVSKDGDCDATYGSPPNGVDDFSETVSMVFDSGNPFTSMYESIDCDLSTLEKEESPRLVTLIILEEPPGNGNNTGYPIVAFAGFHLAGCAHQDAIVDDVSDLDPDCDAPGNRHITPPADLFVAAPELGFAPRPLACHNGQQHGQQTPCATPTRTPTPTPTPTASPTQTPSPTPSPTPSSTPAGNCPPGQCTVYGRFVYLVKAGAAIGPPTDQTTLFGISLVE